MKAIYIDSYGGSVRLKLGEMPDPMPGDDEIVLRVRAAEVNPVDWKICKGQMWPRSGCTSSHAADEPLARCRRSAAG